MAHRILGIGLAMFLGVAVLPAADPDVLRIGFVNSILDESPASARALFAKEFSGLVKDFTGLKSVVTKGINPETSAKQLEDGKWHLGVFHGVEFAWIQAKHPAQTADGDDHVRFAAAGGPHGQEGQRCHGHRRSEGQKRFPPQVPSLQAV